MLSLRNRFGIPGVISVIALVFAMLGGAYAASNSSGGGKATASAKGKRGPRGPKGVAGPAGPAGANGTNGKDGEKGAPGEKGAKGDSGTNGKSVTVTSTGCGGLGGALVKQEGAASGVEVCNGEEGVPGNNGINGANGTSATTASEPKGAHCAEGGIKVSSASPDSYVCNGSPWTAGGTLPTGSTETGAWILATSQAGSLETGGTYFNLVPISFTIPLASELEEEDVHYVEFGTAVPAECEDTNHPGTAKASNPEADAGNFCVYAAHELSDYSLFKIGHLTGFAEGGSNTAGAVLSFFNECTAGEFTCNALGTWAVTG